MADMLGSLPAATDSGRHAQHLADLGLGVAIQDREQKGGPRLRIDRFQGRPQIALDLRLSHRRR
jgi:hypothetical protein